MAKNGYTEPMLFTYNGNMKKNWFVGFRMTDPRSGIRKPFQFKGGINYKKEKSDRVKYGRWLEKEIKTALDGGWDPFSEDIGTFQDKAEVEAAAPAEKTINDKSFREAIDFAMESGNWSKATKRGYRGTGEFFKTAAIKLKLIESPIQSITKQNVVQLVNEIKITRSWSNKAFNKNLGYFSGIIAVLVEWQIIPHNFVHGITPLVEAESNMYVPYTDKEKGIIQEYLIKNHYNYYIYVMCIFHCGLRPKEVLALRIRDINLELQEITIIPDLDMENSKTTKMRVVPVNNHLLLLLKGMHLEDYPKDHFVFGTPYRTASKVDAAKHPDYFRPSEKQVRRDTVTRLWNKIVMVKLGINKYQYAAKHSGADAKLLAGVDMDALKEMYGHSSKQMTEKYTSVLKQVNKKKIIDLSPDF